MSNDAEDPAAGAPAERAARRSPSSVIEQLRAKSARGVRYADQGEIARGGMGSIVRVWDGELQRHLAMKVMLGADDGSASSSNTSASERHLARFLDEALITGQLDHPGIVPVHEIGLDARGRLFFTMRLVKGRELREVIELVHRDAEGWNLTRALGVMLRVCEAMAFAHEKDVVHRDLKPANVMVGRFGEVYVMDWGLAKVLGQEDRHDVRIAKPDPSRSIVRSARAGLDTTPESPLETMDGDIVGTPCYMAPEQARGRLEDIGRHSDVYSVGAMLYELLSGEKPYCVGGVHPQPSAVLGSLMQGPPRALASIRRDIPDELIAVCEKAMARDVRDRYPSMLGMAEDLRAFLEGRVVSAYETGPVAEFKKWIARNQRFAAAVASAVVIALAGIAVALAQQHKANVDLRAANTEVENSRRVAEEEQRQTQVAYQDLARAIEEQQRANDELQTMTVQAQINAALAERRGYAANIAAADASLRLHDVAAARQRLDECAAELRGWEWQYLSARCDASVRTLVEQAGEVRGFAASPDGHAVALGLDSGAGSLVRLIAADSGATLREIPLPAGVLLALDFDQSGARLATVASDRTVRIFEVASGALLQHWTERSNLVQSLDFSPDGTRLLIATTDERVRLRECSSGAAVREYGPAPATVTRVRFAPDGRSFAAASRDGTIAVYALESGERLASLGNREGPIQALAFDPSGDRLLAGGGYSRDDRVPRRTEVDRALRLWDVRDGSLLASWPGHDERVTWCDFDARGRRFMSASEDRSLRVWGFEAGSTQTLLGHQRPIVAADRLGAEALVTAASDGTLCVWEPELADGLALRSSRSNVKRLAFTGDSRFLVAIGDDDAVRAWDTRSGLLQWTASNATPMGFSVTMRCLASTPTGATVALGLNNGAIKLLDGSTGQVSRELAIESSATENVTSLAFARDGGRLAAGSSLGTIRVFDLQASSVQTLPGASSISALAWNADGSELMAAALDRTLVVWDLASATSRTLATDVGGGIATLDFSPSAGRWLASSSGKLELFDARDPSELPAVVVEAGNVAAAFLGDGRRFVTCGARGLVRIYDSERREALLALRSGSGDATALAVAPNGVDVAAAVADGTLRVWSAVPARERHAAQRAALRARELAVPMIEAFFERGVALEQARDEIRANDAISEPLREAALCLLRLCDAKPPFLCAEGWAVASWPNRDPAEYRIAAWQARCAAAAQPDNHRAVFVEGVARHRLGELERANELLLRARTLCPDAMRRVEPELAAFCALNELALGHVEPARAALAELESRMTVLVNARNPRNVDLLQEVTQAFSRPP